ncbi:hypothetical protein H2Y57_05145 [Pectobacterium aroidearum]|uniref:Uncharacterized protein n=1 Tax=Pectobacterium aroidearum TaxID=1201031 RepID=A0AAW3SU69_9GAMM|nr:hypothetical protein [Pectobacterium aroidearum]MBA5203072.1 hypothetical protein [Pectobacterium aroidearum]
MTISTAGMIESVRTAASMTKTQEERDCLNSIANRIEILTTANAGMDLELKSIRAALNIPVNTSVQAGVIAETSRLNDEVLSLRSELSESVALANKLRRTAKEHQEENQSLRTELAERSKQKPYAYAYQYAGCQTCEGFQDWRSQLSKERPPEWMLEDGKVTDLIELFAHPVPPAASQPNREQLRNLVDVVWNAVTESEEVPSTKWADELIDKAFSDLPASQPYTVPDAIDAAVNEILAIDSVASTDVIKALFHQYTGKMRLDAAAMLQQHSNSPQWIGVDWAKGGEPVSGAIKDVIAERQRQISTEGWTPTNIRRDLVKAGALVIAEIERLDRVEAKDGDA